MTDYIIYEDKILNIMNTITLGKENDELVELFKTLWSEFQDSWEEDYWKVYNGLRNKEERKRLNSTADDSIEEDFERLNKRKFTADEVYLESLLGRIDDEIDQAEDVQIKSDYKDSEKKRGCMECLIY
jgi:hypothetical protein